MQGLLHATAKRPTATGDIVTLVTYSSNEDASVALQGLVEIVNVPVSSMPTIAGALTEAKVAYCVRITREAFTYIQLKMQLKMQKAHEIPLVDASRSMYFVGKELNEHPNEPFVELIPK